MGAELVRIEGKNIWGVLDNTLDEIKTFGDFEGCIKAFEHFNRRLKDECQEDYVIEFFEDVIAETLDKGALEEDIKKIKEYFAQWKN